ncbi:uncharacterized protein UTRI_03612_B [Ustilago trichophora]|uniref:Uncharacterized protein n=1 Tax=Ustilago trichophora TaxID=86804 RepID=A0A5C3E2M8_9BASI|nr:uncharacterized protein UTRI_03612_B [Ustilago trichophora]
MELVAPARRQWTFSETSLQLCSLCITGHKPCSSTRRMAQSDEVVALALAPSKRLNSVRFGIRHPHLAASIFGSSSLLEAPRARNYRPQHYRAQRTCQVERNTNHTACDKRETIKLHWKSKKASTDEHRCKRVRATRSEAHARSNCREALFGPDPPVITDASKTIIHKQRRGAMGHLKHDGKRLDRCICEIDEMMLHRVKRLFGSDQKPQ